MKNKKIKSGPKKIVGGRVFTSGDRIRNEDGYEGTLKYDTYGWMVYWDDGADSDILEHHWENLTIIQ